MIRRDRNRCDVRGLSWCATASRFRRPASCDQPRARGCSQVSPNPLADLGPSWRLEAGGSLCSRIGGFRFTMQDDGNLVLYCIDDMKLPPDILHVLSGGPDIFKLYAKPIWSTGTHVPKEGRSRGKYCHHGRRRQLRRLR